MSQTVVPGLTSVIVPCWNQLEFTRHCLRALVRHTHRPWELIVVDNGSTDGTSMYLAGAADLAPVRVEVVQNAENQGFPAACNQGLVRSRGNHLVLLNNDAVVTEGWLDHLISLADSDPLIGLCGPMTNYAPPPQLVTPAPYETLEAMDRFAREWRQAQRGTWFTVEKLSGFCLLLKRRAYEAIGGLDEQFGLGLFDDDDLCLRARRAGYTLAVAHDLFVHHFGSRTFAGVGVDTETLLESNRQRFEAKWGERAPQGRAVGLAVWPGPDESDGRESPE